MTILSWFTQLVSFMSCVNTEGDVSVQLWSLYMLHVKYCSSVTPKHLFLSFTGEWESLVWWVNDDWIVIFSRTELNVIISRGENQKGVSDISPTLQESLHKHVTIVWSDFNYNTDVYTHDYSRKSSLRAFIWYIYLHFTINITIAHLLLTARFVLM